MTRVIAPLALILTLTLSAERATPQSIPATGDEFVGPFPSWTRVTTAYGAKGDGATDDTAAIQRALDELGRDGRSPVLFLPAGTYRITRTLSVGFAMFLSIVGEDPATTVLRWDGPAEGTMRPRQRARLLAHRPADLRRARPRGSRGRAILDGSAPHFDTGNEYADDRFVDVAYGIRGGFRDRGFAETSVVRSRFVRNTSAGIALGNFNALDLWVWDSTFVDCGTGVTNTTGAGNFHVYNSAFEGFDRGRHVNRQYGRVLGARQLLRRFARVLRFARRDGEPGDDSPPAKHHRRCGRHRQRSEWATKDPACFSTTRSRASRAHQVRLSRGMRCSAPT